MTIRSALVHFALLRFTVVLYYAILYYTMLCYTRLHRTLPTLALQYALLCSTSSGPEIRAEARTQVSTPKPASQLFGLGFRVYLDPKEPTFLGLLIMISLYKSLKREVIWG